MNTRKPITKSLYEYMKADLRAYKDYTILLNVHKTDTGVYYPLATLFKTGERVISLDIDHLFENKDKALSFALGASHEAINAILKEETTEFMLTNNLISEGF